LTKTQEQQQKWAFYFQQNSFTKIFLKLVDLVPLDEKLRALRMSRTYMGVETSLGGVMLEAYEAGERSATFVYLVEIQHPTMYEASSTDAEVVDPEGT
jgi:hypothetical protein